MLQNLKGIVSISREWSSLGSSSSCRCISNSPIYLQSSSFHYQSHQTQEKKLKTPEQIQFEKDCRILGVAEDCQDESTVRDAYIKLAKKYHPDSGSPDASASKFQEVDASYKNFLKYFADFRHNRHKIEGEYGLYYDQKRKQRQNPPGAAAPVDNDEESPDIKHTAPQHRQYLSFDGVGSGTPRQREKQYQKWRAMKANDNVLEHRMERVTRSSGQEVWDLAKEQRAAKKIKTGIGIERLVEDMIQEAMQRGDFDNLNGKGKPLSSKNAYNPYIDFTTHKLNQVLIDNGFSPEWIILEKEIKEEVSRLKRQLSEIRHIFNETLTYEERQEWNNYVDALRPDCDKLNKMILKYNLTVPSLHKQVMGFLVDKEADKVLKKWDPEFHKVCKENAEKRKLDNEKRRREMGAGDSSSSGSSGDSFLGSLMSMFKL